MGDDEDEIRKAWVISEARKYDGLAVIMPPGLAGSPLFGALVHHQVQPFLYFRDEYLKSRAQAGKGNAEAKTPWVPDKAGSTPVTPATAEAKPTPTTTAATSPQPATQATPASPRAKIHVVVGGNTKPHKDWIRSQGANFHWDDKVWMRDFFDKKDADVFIAACRDRKLEVTVT